MSKPFSTRSQPWASFDKQSYNIFTDDFVHEKLFTVKANQTSTRGTVNLKGQVSKKENSYKTGSEVKLWFPVWATRSGSLYFRSKDDSLKLHYDDGLHLIKDSALNSYNVYCSFQSNHHLNDVVLKAGLNLISENFRTDNRIRVGLDKEAHNISTGHKISWAKNNFSFASYDIIDWKHSALIKNAIRLGYTNGDNDFFVRAENQTKRGFKSFDWGNPDSYFNKFTLDFIRKIDNLTQVGVETEVVNRNLGVSSLVFQRSIPDRLAGVKAKFSTDKSVALCYQAVLKDYGKWTVGVELSDIGKSNKSRYGLQLDLNL